MSCSAQVESEVTGDSPDVVREFAMAEDKGQVHDKNTSEVDWMVEQIC